MKTFLTAWIVAATVCPSYAETVVLQEDFDGPAGTALNGWNGWTGNGGAVISSTVIDRGNCAAWTGDVYYTFASKGFTHTLRSGEQYVLTATLHAPDAARTYADVRLAASGGRAAKHVVAALGYHELLFTQNGIYDDTMIRAPHSAATMDVRLVVSESNVACYYRNHGESAWTLAGNAKALNSVSAYNTIAIGNDRKLLGAVDSIRLTATSAEPQQEPHPQPK